MIQVTRGEAPDGFAADSTRWSQNFVTEKKINPTISSSQYWSRVRRQPALRQYAKHLENAFHRKCAFCETPIGPTAFHHIEHFLPKGNPNFEDRMFDWNNWLLVCPACNTYKGTYFEQCGDWPCLIDPTQENPNLHLDFRGAFLLYKTDRGKKTRDRIKLDRTDLIDERAKWLMQLDSLLLLLMHVFEVKESARMLLVWALQDDAPFAAMTRAYLGKTVPKLVQPKTPHPRVEPNNPRQQIADLVARYPQVFTQVE